MRRAVFEQLKGFDEGYQVGYSDIELGLRAVTQGLRVIYTPFARLRHHEGASRGFYNPPADVLRAYWQMLPVAIQGDPYFSPNLSSGERRPTVAKPHELAREARLGNILGDFELLYRPIPLAQTPWLGPSGPARYHAAAGTGAAAQAPERRLLLVAHDLGLTGAPLMLAQAAIVLRRAGYVVSVLAPADGPLRETLTQAEVGVWVEPRVLRDARVLARHLDGRALMVANTVLTWRAVLAAKAARMRCLWWIHESEFGQVQTRRVTGLARALEAADRVVFASASIASRYAGRVPPERAAVMHNGLDGEEVALLASASVVEKRPGTLTVVNLASLEPRKGQTVPPRSVAALPRALRDRTRLALLGQTLHRGYPRRLKRMVASTGGRVELLGARPRAEALAYLRQADVVVLPSRDETLPVTLLEAMALGKAIIATRVGGIIEAVHDGVEAPPVPPDDPAALRAALARLLQDEALRRRLGAAARAQFGRPCGASVRRWCRWSRCSFRTGKSVRRLAASVHAKGWASCQWRIAWPRQEPTVGRYSKQRRVRAHRNSGETQRRGTWEWSDSCGCAPAYDVVSVSRTGNHLCRYRSCAADPRRRGRERRRIGSRKRAGSCPPWAASPQPLPELLGERDRARAIAGTPDRQ